MGGCILRNTKPRLSQGRGLFLGIERDQMESDCDQKRCYKCGESKPLDQYWNDSSRPDGRHHRCKECQKAARRTGRPSGRPKTSSIRDEQGRKLCKTCGEWLDISSFTSSSVSSDGLDTRCNKCMVARENRRRSGCVLTYMRIMSASHKRGMPGHSGRRKRLVADSCICTQVLLDLWKEQDGKCAITGLQMTHISGEGRVPTNVSIDRIDASAGYTRDNIQLVCVQVNRMKQELDLDGLKFWCEAILSARTPDAVNTTGMAGNEGSL